MYTKEIVGMLALVMLGLIGWLIWVTVELERKQNKPDNGGEQPPVDGAKPFHFAMWNEDGTRLVPSSMKQHNAGFEVDFEEFNVDTKGGKKALQIDTYGNNQPYDSPITVEDNVVLLNMEIVRLVGTSPVQLPPPEHVPGKIIVLVNNSGSDLEVVGQSYTIPANGQPYRYSSSGDLWYLLQ